MKKALLVILALVLAVAAFASCNIEIDLDKIADKIEEIGSEIESGLSGDPKEPEIYEENGFRYQLNADKTAYLKEYLLDEESVTVPSEVKGCKVTKIEARAFFGKNMNDISIPETVTEIGEFAFANCAKMRWIDLRKGLLTIGESALEGTTALKEIYFAGYTTDWSEVEKGENWKRNDPPTEVVVHCTNNNIKIDG